MRAEITPENVAVAYLCECADQLERSAKDTLHVALAAKSAHCALVAALTTAISGTTSIGAYGPKLRSKWLDWFDQDWEKERQPPPDSDRVMSFNDLLDTATSSRAGWLKEPLHLEGVEGELLDRLTFVRDRLEHVRPATHYIGIAFMQPAILLAARLASRLLREAVGHRLSDKQIGQIESALQRVEAFSLSENS